MEYFWEKEQVRGADQNCPKNISTISASSDYVPGIREIMVQLDSCSDPHPTFSGINVVLVYIPCHAKICYFTFLPFANKNISCCQVTMNYLKQTYSAGETEFPTVYVIQYIRISTFCFMVHPFKTHMYSKT